MQILNREDLSEAFEGRVLEAEVGAVWVSLGCRLTHHLATFSRVREILVMAIEQAGYLIWMLI